MSKILRQSTLLFIVCLALVQFSSSYAEGVFSWLFSSSSKTDAKQQLFSRVPADTSWIMANVKRMPEKVAEAWLEKIQYIINSYLVLITKPTREEPDKKGLKRLTGLLEFAKDKLTPDKLEEIGLRIDPYFAFYGNKLMPSLRMELSDGAKLKAEIDKAFNEANKLSHPASSSTTISKENPAEQLQWISEGELHYLHFKHPKGVQNNLEEEGRDESYLDVIVAIEPKWLSLGFVEAGNSKQLKRFLGKAKLEQPLRAETISQLSKDYGYNGLGQGYLDTRKFYQQISAIALASKKTDEDVKKQLQSCDKLANLTFDHLPRIIIGMTQFSETTFAQQILFELSADVVESLKSVPTAMAGYQQNPLLGLGLAVDLKALRTNLTGLINFIDNNAGKCKVGSKDNIKAMRQVLVFGINPMFTAYKSIAFVLENLEIQMPPKDQPGVLPMPKQIDAYLMVGVDDPAGVVALLSLMLPALTEINMPTDGSLVDVPLEKLGLPLPPLPLELKVGAKDKQLGISLGKSSESLKGHFAKPGSATPLFWSALDYQKIAKLLEAPAKKIQQQSGFSEEEFQALLDIYLLAGRYVQTIELADTGLKFKIHMDELALKNK